MECQKGLRIWSANSHKAKQREIRMKLEKLKELQEIEGPEVMEEIRWL